MPLSRPSLELHSQYPGISFPIHSLVRTPPTIQDCRLNRSVDFRQCRSANHSRRIVSALRRHCAGPAVKGRHAAGRGGVYCTVSVNLNSGTVRLNNTGLCCCRGCRQPGICNKATVILQLTCLSRHGRQARNLRRCMSVSSSGQAQLLGGLVANQFNAVDFRLVIQALIVC